MIIATVSPSDGPSFLALVLVVYGPGAIITLDQAPPDYIKIASLITLTYDDS